MINSSSTNRIIMIIGCFLIGAGNLFVLTFFITFFNEIQTVQEQYFSVIGVFVSLFISGLIIFPLHLTSF